MAYWKTLISTAVLILDPFSLCAQNLLRTVEVDSGRASLGIPRGWQEIPQDILEYYSLQMAQASGGMTAESYQHGFGPGSTGASLGLPMVLIQVRESGRIKYRQFLDLPPIKTMQEEGTQRLKNRVSPILSDLALERVQFDRETYCLRVSSSFESAIFGPVSVVSASYLTERGMFIVHCYSQTSRRKEIAPIYGMVIGSVQFDEATAYQPRLSDYWPPKPSSVALSAAGIAAIAFLILLLRRIRDQAADSLSL